MSIVVMSAIVAYISGIVAESSMYISPTHWKLKRIIAWFVLATNVYYCLIVVKYIDANLFVAGLLFVTIYRLINLIKIIVSRIKYQQLISSCSRSFGVLASIQTAFSILVFVMYFNDLKISSQSITLYLAFITLISSMVVFVSTIVNIINTRTSPQKYFSDSELPTVTVAIAARNETESLFQCIQSVLYDSYPKLEIIVYDDESSDRTLDIIRDFAHDGVRFIQGGKVPNNWLAKNYAYEILSEQSAGEIIMFIGVDIRLHMNSIRTSVSQLIEKNIDMLTIMPKRAQMGLVAMIIQPMRYWWEIAVPRNRLSRPPALSSTWLIYKSQLVKIGGFVAFKGAILPENHIANILFRKNKYGFIRSSSDLQITTHKDFSEQWINAVRTRYPQNHRRPESIMLVTAFLLLCVVLPFILIFVILFTNLPLWYEIIFALCVFMYIVSHSIISYFTNPILCIFAAINFPIVVLMDVVLLNYSMLKYEFSTVIWKGRNVSDSAMHVYKKLPKLD